MNEEPVQPPLHKLYLLAVLTQLIWALNNNLSKFALQAFPPFLLAGGRMLICTAIMVPIVLWRGPSRLEPGQWWKVCALGAVGVGVNQLFFVLGMANTSVTHAAFILPLTPILAMLLAAALGQEKIKRSSLLGMAIAFTGVIVLQLSKQPSRGATLLGDFYIFCGITSFALYIVLAKRATRTLDGPTFNGIAYLSSSVMLLPFTVAGARGFDFTRVPTGAWLSLAYMAIFSSIIGYLLYYYVLTHMMPSRLSAFSYMQPPISTAIAALMFNEPITLLLVISGALVLAGVYVTERSR